MLWKSRARRELKLIEETLNNRIKNTKCLFELWLKYIVENTLLLLLLLYPFLFIIILYHIWPTYGYKHIFPDVYKRLQTKMQLLITAISNFRMLKSTCKIRNRSFHKNNFHFTYEILDRECLLFYYQAILIRGWTNKNAAFVRFKIKWFHWVVENKIPS